jgi:hypothetical protein
LIQNIIPAQRLFENSEEVLAIFTDIFRNLQRATSLSDVSFGLKRPSRGTLLGLTRAMNDIGVMEEGGFVCTSNLSAQLAQEPTGLDFSLRRSGVAGQAMKLSGFNKNVVHLNVQTRCTKLSSVRVPIEQHTTILRKHPYPGIRLPNLRSLTISDPDHTCSLSSSIISTLQVSELSISCCDTEDACTHCVDLIQGLEDVSLPNLTTLKLSNMSLGEVHLVVFFSTLESRLKDLSMHKMHLVHGTWRGMFKNTAEFLDLKLLMTKELWELEAGLPEG